MPIRILIADDHAIVRDGLRLLLGRHPDLVVVGEAGDGLEAVQAVRQLAPDVVLMDIMMPGLDGISATRRLEEAGGAARVVMLSMYAAREYVFRAFMAGACGYVLKEAAGAEVCDAVRAAAAGRGYLSPGIQGVALADLERDAHARRGRSPAEQLSGRERQVMQMMVGGISCAAAARRLGLSPKTVETYRSRLMRKLGVTGVPALVKLALAQGWLGDE